MLLIHATKEDLSGSCVEVFTSNFASCFILPLPSGYGRLAAPVNGCWKSLAALSYVVVLFGETPLDGTDKEADLLILSVGNTVLAKAFADTLLPSIPGHRC